MGRKGNMSRPAIAFPLLAGVRLSAKAVIVGAVARPSKTAPVALAALAGLILAGCGDSSYRGEAAGCAAPTFTVTNFDVGGNLVYLAVGDFNGDGHLDLATPNISDGTVSILLGTGTGSFGAATNFGVGNAPFFVAVGDFNGEFP
jgi:VCBS repeat protein